MIRLRQAFEGAPACVLWALVLGACASSGTPPTGGPEALTLDGPRAIEVGACTAYDVTIHDSDGERADALNEIELELTSTGAGRFFGDADCDDEILVSAIDAGDSSLTLFFADAEEERATLRVNDAAGRLRSASVSVDVSADPVERRLRLTGSTRLYEHECGAYELTVDGLDSPASITVSTTLGALFADGACATPAPSASVAPESPVATIYLRHVSSGDATVRAALDGLGLDDELAVSISPLGFCPDLTEDGLVDASDEDALAVLLGSCADSECAGDFNGDRVVDLRDASILEGNAGPCPASQLAWDGPELQPVDDCVAHTVTITNSLGMPLPADGDRLVALSGAGSGAFFADVGCATATSDVTIADGQSAAAVFFQDGAAETVNLSAASPDLVGVSHVVEVVPSDDHLVIAGPTSLTRYECNRYEAEVRGPGGELAPVTDATDVDLSIMGTGLLFSDQQCRVAVTRVVIDGGASTNHFFFQSDAVGTHTLVGTAADVTSGSLPIEVSEMVGCAADVDGNGTIDSQDLSSVLSNYGACADPSDCPQDINGDGDVGQPDLSILTGYWGACP